MDIGTVSSDDVIESYKRQLMDAHERIAMLEAALARIQRSTSGQSTALQAVHDQKQRDGIAV